MLQTLPRQTLQNHVRTLLAESPCVVLVGARQVGKTTLARMLMETWDGTTRLFDLEVSQTRIAFETSAQAILSQLEGLIVIDEVQLMPHLFSELRPILDDPGRRATFLLLGSSTSLITEYAAESLAGRVHYVDVGGFSLQDVGEENEQRLWLRGGLPRAYLAHSSDTWLRWLESFTRTYIERDIASSHDRLSAQVLSRYWSVLAHLHGKTWNTSDVARTLGLRPAAVREYRDAIEGASMLRVLQPWHNNLGKRLVKSPKLYVRDSGVFHAMLGITSMEELLLNPSAGSSWEGFVIECIVMSNGIHRPYFYATQRGAELDLVVETRGRRLGFECKLNANPSSTKSMHVALADLDLHHLYVVHPGELSYSLGERITAVPLAAVAPLPTALPS